MESQKDLRITITNNLSPSNHVTNIVKKANSRINMIRRCFTGYSRKKIETLHTSIVRPILEYASPAWSPWLVKDINLLEKNQKRCLRVCPERIEIEFLPERKDRMDLVETYKFIKGKYKTPATKFFTKSNTQQLQGHSEKLFKPRCRLDVRKHYFCHRVIDNWNNLPEESVSAETENIFKKRLQRAVADT